MPSFKTDYSNQNMFVPIIIDEQLSPAPSNMRFLTSSTII